MNTEHAHTINGVEGRMFARHTRNATKGTFSNQTWKASRPLPSEPNYRVTFEMRFDDACGNGHNTFSITGEVKDSTKRGEAAWVSAGQCVDELREAFPELAHLLKWHLVSSDGPIHYLANTLYQAGDRDHYGLLAGEARQIRNGKTGKLAWKLSEHDLPKYIDSDTQPEGTATLRYEPWLRVGEGKARELDHARSSAVWPEATDADLTAPGLRERLEARLPALMAEFRAAVESCGFDWEAK